MNYPKDIRGRYVRIPTPLKKRSQSNGLINTHKKFIFWYKKKLGITDYGMLWLVFFKGVFLTIIIERIIFQ